MAMKTIKRATSVAALPAAKTKFTKTSTRLAPHELVLSSTVQSAVGVFAWGKFAGEPDMADLVDDLRDQIDQVRDGDMRRVEAMLYAQSLTLQTMFTSLSCSAVAQPNLKNMETYLRMALKAQNQCRMTLETLATIKNPPVVFARQANIVHGAQQVNHGSAPTAPRPPSDLAHAANYSIEESALLEAQHGQRLDTGKTGAASPADPHLEAVGEVHRRPD